jgi:signal transduction histidine kinase
LSPSPAALSRRVTVRLRLTLLYGGLFFAAGVLLLTVAYVLVTNILESLPLEVRTTDPFGISQQEQQAIRQSFIDNAQHRLIWQSAFALLGVGLIALALGWFVADRALGPLQKVTATARRLSGSTLHERIALQGPEDEIKELADTFDAMLERLNQAFDAQRRFVGNASHELRTPLAINRTLLEVAVTDPEASEDLKTVGRTLLANNARHERLIEGLLLLARSERELTTRTPVDLSEVAAMVLKTHGGGADRPDIKVTTELTPGSTVGDPVLLEHLVSNLVGNAVRYNVEDGTVVVRTGILDGWATCQVENTGPVVPAYEVQNLFEPFRRLNTDRIESAKGAGLGLSIVRSVAAAHGGTVIATPHEGGGLIVTVRLPRS